MTQSKNTNNRDLNTLLRFVCGTTLAIGVSLSAEAQTRWEKQGPYPTEVSLHGVAFNTPDHGFVVGEQLNIIETFDGGESWVERDRGEYWYGPYYSIKFVDAMHGYITGNNSEAWRTVDGGVNWIPMTDIPAGSWSHIDFLTPTVGYIGANGACAFTDDGGVTWQIRSGYPDCPVMFSMDFRDLNIGLAPGIGLNGQDDGIFRTTDGGQTWDLALPIVTNHVVFTTANRAVASVVGDLRIYESTDTGQTWVPISQAFDEHGPHSTLFPVTSTRLIGLSHEGDIWLSTDAGFTWTLVFDEIGDLPYKWEVNFLDDQHGWVVGPHGILIGTSDGGFTWEIVSRGIGMPIYQIEMLDDSFGLAVAENTYLVRTTDSGNNWVVQKPEVTGQQFLRDETFRGVDILNERVAVAVGLGGTVFKTTDGALTWESIGYPDLPEGFWAYDVECVTEQDIWVVGQDLTWGRDQSVYHTTDGGQTWTTPFNHGAIWGRVQFVDDQHGWIHGVGGILERTEDGGATWEEILIPGDPLIEDIVYVDPMNGWIVGWWGYYARTRDGGRTWETNSFGNDIRTVFAVDSRDGVDLWAIAQTDGGFSRDVSLHSTDGGATWKRETINGSLGYFQAVSVTETGRVWAAGFNGEIHATNPLPDGAMWLTANQLHRGATAEFTAHGAVPGETVHFLYSTKGTGNGPCPRQLGGLCIDLINPVTDFGSAASDANGVAVLSQPVPANAPLRDVWFQTLSRRGNGGNKSVLSNSVRRAIMP
ncbi:MAG: hypothetical protein D8M59_02425 [Planctomycetes bacterium]|nr:hypothetical protein [Planctomycetota bacterium]NOG54425.1 hypothetical protein [Planctomycetota bacterium]